MPCGIGAADGALGHAAHATFNDRDADDWGAAITDMGVGCVFALVTFGLGRTWGRFRPKTPDKPATPDTDVAPDRPGTDGGGSNGTLTGERTSVNPEDSPENIRALTLENDSADILIRNGYDVEQNPSIPGPKNPDYRIDGELYDLKSPTTGRVRNIASTLEDALAAGQADRFVVNLSGSSATASQLRAQLAEYPIPGLQHVLVITDSGAVVSVWP